MTDLVEPFRAEFLRSYERTPYDGWSFSGFINYMESRIGKHDWLSVNVMRKHGATYRAAKALEIAETEGPDRAIIWKLSN